VATRVTCAMTVFWAVRKNGSYPMRVATAFRSSASPGQISAPGPRSEQRGTGRSEGAPHERAHVRAQAGGSGSGRTIP